MARPLTLQQPVNKGKVWAIFVGSAVALYGSAVLLERNSTLFPSIYKANEAMRAARAAAEVRSWKYLGEGALCNM